MALVIMAAKYLRDDNGTITHHYTGTSERTERTK